MKKQTVSYLGIFAFVFAAGAALATQTPKAGAASQQWTRVTNNGNIEWRAQALSQMCQPSDELCKAIFPEGYDPNDHSNSENEAFAESVIQSDGVVEL